MLTGFAISVSDPPAIFASAKARGAQSLRVDVPWTQVELSRGRRKIPAASNAQLNEMLRLGLEPLVILDYGNLPVYGFDKPKTAAQIASFGDYAVFVVGKLLARGITRFELWNEWETRCGATPGAPGTAAEYMAMASAVVPRLRALGSMTLLCAGMSRPAIDNAAYIDTILTGGATTLFDGLSFHPYAIAPTDTPASCMAKLDAIQAKAAAIAGRPVAFYVTEMGWSTYTPRPAGYDENAQAANLTTWLALCRARSWIEGDWTYCLRDQGLDPAEKEGCFGVFTNSMAAKPAAAAFQASA